MTPSLLFICSNPNYKKSIIHIVSKENLGPFPHKVGGYSATINLIFRIFKLTTRYMPSISLQAVKTEAPPDYRPPSSASWQDEPLKMEKKHNRNASSSPSENDDLAHIVDHDPRTAVRPLSGYHLPIVLFILVFGLFLSTVETSITATALVKIGIYFNDSYTANWVVLSYLLTYMGFSVIFARLSDAIGRKFAILLSWLIFGFFSLASGLSTSLTQLIIFRSFQGIGGSGLFTMAMTVAPQVTPVKYWGLLSGSLGAALACSSLIGPIAGGVITQRFGWRWIYLYNAPCAAMIIIPFLLSWPKDRPHANQSRSLLLTQVDVPGALLLLSASTLLVFALDQGGSYRLNWNSTTIILCLLTSALCGIMFICWIIFVEAGKCRINIKPIFSLKSSLVRPIGPAIALSFMSGFPFFIVMINLPIRFQILNGNSPTMAGVHLMPLLALSATGSCIGGLFSVSKNRTYYTLVFAFVLMCLGTGLLSTIPNSRVISHLQYLYQAILGLGIGLSLSSITVMTGLASNYESIASVNGAVNQARVLGGSIGLSVANIILNNEISNKLTGILTPMELTDLQQSLNTAIKLAPSKQLEVVRVYASSFNSQMRICLYLSIFGFFVSHLTYKRVPASVRAYQAQQEAMNNNDQVNQP